LTDVHVTLELLCAVSNGELPPQVLVEIGVDHLIALCPHCREELRRWQVLQEASGTWARRLVQALPALLDRHAGEAEAKSREAEGDYQDLMTLPHPERLGKIRRATRRFRGVLLAGKFLDESKRIVPEDPARSYDLAETAQAVLLQTPGIHGTADHQARAAAFQGNALRAQGRLQEAQARFDFARLFIQKEGVTDPLLLAEIDSCEAVLALDRRRLTHSEKLLKRAIHLYTIAGAKAQTAQPLLTLGYLQATRGDYEQAIQTVRTAAETADPADLRTALYARHNQACYLCELGSFEAAAATVQEIREMYEEFPDPYTQLRLAWVEGKIAAGQGRSKDAERAFQTVFQAYLDHHLGYDAALVSLDLALLYAREGRTADLKALAGRMHPIFAAEEVHREAAAALLLFQEAAGREATTLGLLENLSAYLKAARGNPALRFRRSGQAADSSARDRLQSA
jgi:hypothetical protein